MTARPHVEEEIAWMHDGACVGMDPEIFFPSYTGGIVGVVGTKAAKDVCKTCEVREQCLDYALRNMLKHGVWGGTSEKERRMLRRSYRRRTG